MAGILRNRRRCAEAGRAAGSARGFTLIETAFALVIIGVAVLALIEAQTAFMRTNDWSTHAATATYLANEIREMTSKLPRHDPVTGLYMQAVNGAGQLRGWGPETGETTVADFDDLDDFDGVRLAFNGTAGLGDGDLPGPVDAFGAVIPEIDPAGAIVLDGEGNPRPLQGWGQVIRVQKIDPFDPSITYPNDQTLPANAGTGFPGLAVDRFPLRVSVTVTFRGVFDTEDVAVAEVVWIVP